MNLCQPDDEKSCAACCGLYNVPDGTRPALQDKLERHTILFQNTVRSADGIDAYRERIRREEADAPLDEVIHVCEFTGFLDPFHRIVGCQLHPASPGNGGLDLRGLCHYGSMACKAFYCPAWTEIPERYRGLLVRLINDWHLYGLVVTDVDFVTSLFGLLESRTGLTMGDELCLSMHATEILASMISWKNTWPFGASSPRRRSRYHFKGHSPLHPTETTYAERILDCLEFGFDMGADRNKAVALILEGAGEFARACSPEKSDSSVRKHSANQ